MSRFVPPAPTGNFAQTISVDVDGDPTDFENHFGMYRRWAIGRSPFT